MEPFLKPTDHNRPPLDLDLDQAWSYHGVMISENVSQAKAKLSYLINAALQGEDVTICKDGVAAVRLVPVRPILGEDPCREIPELSISVGEEAMRPLGLDAWGEWASS